MVQADFDTPEQSEAARQQAEYGLAAAALYKCDVVDEFELSDVQTKHMFMMTEEAYELTGDTDSTGKGVIDSGATRTVASAMAMESIAQEIGSERIRIDANRRPRFKFGNGSRGVASSTAYVRYEDIGEVEIAVIETERYVPVLLSIALLRRIKATIEFATGIMTSEKGMTQLETLGGGHLAMNLCSKNLCNE